ncbi:hypothetical protein Mia14_0266 [Candidatus Mancarchaeum acidiphilum]|uniref:Uncharacterized protein n=1 Tax=Candidatus Mancarchaeum acidiphilum TaxID=1920749 RepID=A0A218NMA6_9ARCH|nr:hypothetical protein [Candidatus Mancarchaeum acidiphilum]ASI13596.1 hypothetical protein Mia14_0266 [Candidatus Mancarchaeum acidiphilum]
MDNAHSNTVLINNKATSKKTDMVDAIIKDENRLIRLNRFKFLRNEEYRLSEKKKLYADIKLDLESLNEKGALDYLRDSIYMLRENKQKNLYGVNISDIYQKLDKRVLNDANNEINNNSNFTNYTVIILDTKNNRKLASNFISRIISSKAFSNF